MFRLKMARYFGFAIAIYALFGSDSLNAKTIHVPADQPTIQAGIDAAIAGDTVLVADGIYTGPGNRDIDFHGKGILLKSENGPDMTIIDAEGNILDRHRGFAFHSGEDSSAVVDGFTIQGGFGPSGISVGGGIKCESSSSPTIINNIISDNFARDGGGIYCDRSNPTISNNTISGNSALFGSGIFCTNNSNPIISNNIISDNIALHPSSSGGRGGGIYCDISSPSITDNVISNNIASGVAGGFGGGIYCTSSNPQILRNTITRNSAMASYEMVIPEAKGGGIYLDESNPMIGGSSGNGNLFQYNTALIGADIFDKSSTGVINTQYNTFTIYPVSSNYVIPLINFDLTNGAGLYTPITQDAYVSPSGNNENDGLTPTTALLNVHFALGRVLPVAHSPIIIHLAPGIYSPSETGEVFPLRMTSYVSLEGSGPETSVLDAESENPIPEDSMDVVDVFRIHRVIYCWGADSLTISRLGIQGGIAGSGGGIYCESSSPTIQYTKICADSAIWGGGIFCTDNSNPIIANNTIIDNGADRYSPSFAILGGGIVCWDNSNPFIINNLITDNSAFDYGGGIMCNLNSNPTIVNNTLVGNTARISGGGLLCWNNSSPVVQNTILWNNSAPTGSQIDICCSSAPIVSCSDIQGGWVGSENFDADPLFCDTASGNYHIDLNSPCAPPNNSCSVLIGALGIACGDFVCADANGDSLVTVDDISFLQTYYTQCGTEPSPYFASDVNCDGIVDIQDIIYLATYLNANGPEPCCQ